MSLEREIHEAWRNYLSANGCRQVALSSLFEAGYMAGKGIAGKEVYECKFCNRKSYPDYGNCAFCGVRRLEK